MFRRLTGRLGPDEEALEPEVDEQASVPGDVVKEQVAGHERHHRRVAVERQVIERLRP